MREDMYKVIVERPRWGSRMRTRDGRLYRASEDLPGKLGMKRGYTNHKSLNENLSPLKRWLESQVNRPWNKVYAELCASIDRRNTVQEHIFTHIENFVERETKLVEGKVMVLSRWRGGWQPIDESWAGLYVHPTTGILRENRHRVTNKQAWLKRQKAEIESLAAKRRDIGPFEQLHCMDGVWYHVTLAEMNQAYRRPGPSGGAAEWVNPLHWDVLQKKMITCNPRHGQIKPAQSPPYGKSNLYAAAKRQLSSAELKRHGLTSENAGNSRRFRLWGANRSRMCWQRNKAAQD